MEGEREQSKPIIGTSGLHLSYCETEVKCVCVCVYVCEREISNLIKQLLNQSLGRHSRYV